MKAALFSLLINGLIFGTLFADMNKATETALYLLDIETAQIKESLETLPAPEPEPEPEPEPAPVNERAVDVLQRVVCGEVGAHHPDTGRNVLQVIANRATLKVSETVSLEDALVAAATRKVGGTPQFATHCRADSRREWQREIARAALRGEWVGDAEWLSSSTLFFRTHVGAHRWERRRGWTRNIFKVGADKYHTFFDANEQGVRFMARY